MLQNATSSSKEQQLAWEFLSDSPTVRMFEMRINPIPSELMSRPLGGRHAMTQEGSAISDRAYFQQRLNEERTAALNGYGAQGSAGS